MLFGLFSGGLMRVPAAGGPPEEATKIDSGAGEIAHSWPQWLPDGKHFLYLARNASLAKSAIFAGEAGSAKRVQLLRTTTPALATAEGYLLFAREHSLLAQRFDANSLQLSGEPIPIAVDVAQNDRIGRSPFAVSENGVLIYRFGGGYTAGQLKWVDRNGTSLGSVGKPAEYTNIQLSPDDKYVAFYTRADQQRDPYLAEMNLATGVVSRVGAQDEAASAFTWAPDSKKLYYTRVAAGLFYFDVDSGSVSEIPLEKRPPPLDSFTPDGKQLLLSENFDFFLLSLDGERKMRRLVDDRTVRHRPQISPDGSRLAWDATEGAREEVFVASFPSLVGKRQVSSDGGSYPRWSRDGRELYFRAGQVLMAVPVQPGTSLAFGAPKPLFQWRSYTNTSYSYAPSSDRNRFLILGQAEGNEVPQVTVVTNWSAELKH